MKVINPTILSTQSTFTRASTGTYIDSTGALQYAINDEPRFSYDLTYPTNSGQFLLEPAKTNNALYSEDFTNAAWSKSFLTITGNATTAPDGNLTADRIVEDNTTNQRVVSINISSVTIGSKYTISVYAKAAERTRLSLTSNAEGYSVFDLSDGTIYQTGGNTCSITKCANGWYRISATITKTNSTPTFYIIPWLGNAGGNVYLGSTSAGLYIWGAQIESDGLTSYIPTTSTVITRSADNMGSTTFISNILRSAPTTKWVSTSTYNVNDIVYSKNINGLLSTYKCKVSNSNLIPDSNPTYWLYLGTVYQTWSNTVNYGFGERVQSLTTNKIYESLIAGNTNNVVTDTTKWLEYDDTSYVACLDYIKNNQTTNYKETIICLNPKTRVDGLALFGLTADIVNIKIYQNNNIVYSTSTTLQDRRTTSWYSYFFTKIRTKPNYAYLDIPPYSDAVIQISLYSYAGPTALTYCVIGKTTYLGGIQYNASDDVLNYSTINRDFAGGINLLVQRRNINKTIQNLQVSNTQVTAIREVRNDLNAMPAAWIGLEDSSNNISESVLVFGIYKKFAITLAHTEHANIALEIEEV